MTNGTAVRRCDYLPRRRVTIRGVAYWMNVEECRAKVNRLQVEGRFETRGDLARAAKLSIATVSRFLCGQTGLPSSLRILAVLGLTFDEVFTRCSAPDEANAGHGGDADTVPVVTRCGVVGRANGVHAVGADQVAMLVGGSKEQS